MRKVFLILLGTIIVPFAVLSTSATTVETGYRPMLSEGKVWNYTLHSANGDERVRIEIKGDTIISEQKCHKLYLSTSHGSWLYGCYYEAEPLRSVWAYPMLDILFSEGQMTVQKKQSQEPKQVFIFTDGVLSPWYSMGGGNDYMSSFYTVMQNRKPWLSVAFHNPYPHCLDAYDLIKKGGDIFARARFVADTPESELSETWVSGIGDSRWGILMPVQEEGMLEFESCMDGERLFTVADFDAEAVRPEYRPFVEEGKVWTYKGGRFDPSEFHFFLHGDTVVAGRACIKMYSENLENDGKVRYNGAYYEQDRKVYYYQPDSETPTLKYDFSLRPGEGRWMTPRGLASKELRDSTGIHSIADVYEIHDGIPCHLMVVFEISGNDDDIYYDYLTGTWIEGVGPAFKLNVGQMWGYGAMGGDGDGCRVEDCSVNGVSIYHSPWYGETDGIDQPTNKTQQMAYRPFVEDGKVWKVGDITSGSPVQLVDYYYFDGDTIVDGKTCKQMMRQGYVNPDYVESHNISQVNSLSYVGAWYEEKQKVYAYDSINKQFKMMYDFSLEDNGTFQRNDLPYVYVIGPRQIGGIKGFKGVYRDVWECEDEERIYKCAPWLEGVGIVYGPPTTNVCNVELADSQWFLMSCTVGDEVIYLNDEYEDGATPDGVRKRRFDFTHTIKTQPKARNKSGVEKEQSPYGEYNEQWLGINLDPLEDAYQVRITDETGQTVYKKAIDAGNIVGLNIDISAYAEGRYTVTVENSRESFTGEFDAVNADVDGDGILTAKDIIAIINVISGKATDEALKSAADVNGDGVVNVADIMEITNIMGQ